MLVSSLVFLIHWYKLSPFAPVMVWSGLETQPDPELNVIRYNQLIEADNKSRSDREMNTCRILAAVRRL